MLRGRFEAKLSMLTVVKELYILEQEG